MAAVCGTGVEDGVAFFRVDDHATDLGVGGEREEEEEEKDKETSLTPSPLSEGEGSEMSAPPFDVSPSVYDVTI